MQYIVERRRFGMAIDIAAAERDIGTIEELVPKLDPEERRSGGRRLGALVENLSSVARASVRPRVCAHRPRVSAAWVIITCRRPGRGARRSLRSRG
jgi:hypothetical protein